MYSFGRSSAGGMALTALEEEPAQASTIHKANRPKRPIRRKSFKRTIIQKNIINMNNIILL